MAVCVVECVGSAEMEGECQQKVEVVVGNHQAKLEGECQQKVEVVVGNHQAKVQW
jgi:hypothetical protein